LRRTELVTVDRSITSSWAPGGVGTDGPRESLYLVAHFSWGIATPDTAAALLALSDAVAAEGGDLRITELHRDTEVQAAARTRYENWLHAGKPPTHDPAFEHATMKPHYVARPGRTFHSAGRAIDIDLDALWFDRAPASRRLDLLWDVAVPLGWRPVIRQPDEHASEAWHLDYLGPWRKVLDLHGYETAAICANLDVGNTTLPRSDARWIQAQLHRAGFDVGDVDGYLGPRTEAGLGLAGAPDIGRGCLHEFLAALPDGPYR